MSAVVSQELRDTLKDAVLHASEVVNGMIEQCAKLPSSGANPTMFGDSRRNAAVGKNKEALDEAGGMLREQAQQLTQTATAGVGLGQGGTNREDDEQE